MKKQHKWLPTLLLLGAALLARAQPTGWSVDPQQYQYGMTAVAQLQLDGAPNNGSGNYLAAFYKGRARGSAVPVEVNGQIYYFLNLYANRYKGDTLYFLAYVGAAQKVYESVDSLVFKHQTTRGGVSSPFVVHLRLSTGPVLYSPTAFFYVEGGCGPIADLQSSDDVDAESNGLQYSIIGGADMGRFALDPQTGVLSWQTGFAPHASSRGDANGDNVYLVEVQVADRSGKKSAQSIAVTVTDRPTALAVCPASKLAKTSDDGPGNCGTAVAGDLGVALPTACPIYNVGYTLEGATSGQGSQRVPADQVFNAGTTTVRYTVTDRTTNAGGACSFTVSVVDDEPLTANCPANKTADTAPGACAATLSGTSLSLSDNCPGPPIAFALEGATSGAGSGQVPPNQAFATGVTTVRYTVRNAGGLPPVSCSFTVTVTDNEPPALACPAGIAVNSGSACFAAPTATAATTSDNCGGAVLAYAMTGAATGSGLGQLPVGQQFPGGATTVVYTATDGDGVGQRSCSFTVTVTVTENTPPTIACPTNQTRSTNPGQCAASVTHPTPTAADNCGLPLGQPAWVSGGGMPTASGPNSTATFPKGVTTSIWRATDAAGNSKTCSFRVVVNDVEAPALACPTPAPVNAAQGACNAVVTYANPAFTDNCSPASGTAIRVSGPASGAAFPVGNTNVTFQATDAAGNTRRCTMAVAVADNQPPTVNCPASFSVAGGGSPCNATAFYPSLTATDNCAGTLTPFLLSGLASGSKFPAGATTNTWRAIAPNGQTGDCSFTVTVTCGLLRDGGAENREAEALKTQNSKLKTRLFPNPAGHEAWLDLSACEGLPCEVCLTDARGALLQQHHVAQTTPGLFRLDLDGLPAGLYFVRVQAQGQGARVLKLAVERFGF